MRGPGTANGSVSGTRASFLSFLWSFLNILFLDESAHMRNADAAAESFGCRERKKETEIKKMLNKNSNETVNFADCLHLPAVCKFSRV